MKRLSVCIFMLLTTMVCLAQPWQRAKSQRSPQAAPAKVNKVTVQPANNQFWWGYFNENDGQALGESGAGVSSKDDYEAAIYIPANDINVGKSSIQAIRLWIGNYVSKITGLRVWIAKSLTKNASGADYVQDVDPSLLVQGANDIALDAPFDVNDQAIYVGFSMKLNDQAYAVMCSGTYEENSFFIRSENFVPEWQTLEDYGKLALQVLLDGVQIPDFGAVPSDFGNAYVDLLETTTLPVTITNTGKNPLTSITYTISTDGTLDGEYTVPMNNTPYNSSETIYVQFSGGYLSGKYKKTLTITKVCGMQNGSEDNSAYGALIVHDESIYPVPVVEEFTATWCGWCPIGIEGMNKVSDEYGNLPILISVHGGDVMAISDYAPILERINGYPAALVSRYEEVYPTDVNLIKSVGNCRSLKTVGDIDVTAEWDDSSETTVSITTTTTFDYNEDDGNYGIAFVLLEDGMRGTGTGWEQKNLLSGNPNYSSYSFWYVAPNSVSDMKYDHVAVGAWGIENGIDGSVSTSFTKFQPLKYNYIVDLSTKKNFIQDNHNLKVVALLIDRTNGRIINADQSYIRLYRPYDLHDVNRDRNVDISDVVAIINAIAGNGNTPYSRTADVNRDNKVDISDVVSVINCMANSKEYDNGVEPPVIPPPPAVDEEW